MLEILMTKPEIALVPKKTFIHNDKEYFTNIISFEYDQETNQKILNFEVESKNEKEVHEICYILPLNEFTIPDESKDEFKDFNFESIMEFDTFKVFQCAEKVNFYTDKNRIQQGRILNISSINFSLYETEILYRVSIFGGKVIEVRHIDILRCQCNL